MSASLLTPREVVTLGVLRTSAHTEAHMAAVLGWQRRVVHTVCLELEQDDWISKVKRRPLTWRLSSKGAAAMGATGAAEGEGSAEG